MKRLLLILLVPLLGVALLALGLSAHFPGAALSRFVATRVNLAVPQLGVVLTPAELGWGGLTIERVELLLNGAARPTALVSLRDLRLAVPWRPWRGLPVSATLGDKGRIDALVPWRGAVSFALRDIRFEEIPALRGALRVPIRGSLRVDGALERPPAGAIGNELPKGRLSGYAEGIEIGPYAQGGVQLPAARIERVDLKLTSDRALEVEQFAFRGDVQGTVSGSIVPRLDRPEQSALRLNVQASFRPDWLQRLGALRLLFDAMLVNGSLNGTVTGTAGRPNFALVPRSR
ncbi:MAG: type II secretion system protein GspN [Candidatus Lambdaproteobacteria bacterium]|nr:type II secretion system protein GspN [Candidatus Lambdaproteobacteria bacterium]